MWGERVTKRSGIAERARFRRDLGDEAAKFHIRGPIHTILLFFIFYFHPIYYLRPSILSLLAVTQIRGLIAGSSPLPTTVRSLHFYREKISALRSLVGSRRIVLTHVRRSQQLVVDARVELFLPTLGARSS